MTKEERKEYNKAYQAEYRKKNKEKTRAYQKAYRNLQKMHHNTNKQRWLKMRQIEPTQEEMGWITSAANAHVFAFNKCRTGDFMTVDDIMGDSYEGLLIALYLYDPAKVKTLKKKTYCIQKMRQHLLDCYRREFGRHGKKLVGYNCVSLNIKADSDDENSDDLLNMIECEDNNEEKVDCSYFLAEMKKEFKKLDNSYRKSKKNINHFKIWKDRFYNNMTMDSLAKKYDVSESRISQLFSDRIDPLTSQLFDRFREQDLLAY